VKKDLIKKNNRKNKPLIHGESFVNGVMMNDEENISIAFRKKDGSIGEIVDSKVSLVKKYSFLNVFVVRSIIRFFEGSFNQFYAVEQMKKEEHIEHETAGVNNHGRMKVCFIVFLTILAGFILYFIVPFVVVFYSKNLLVFNTVVLNLIEGILRLIIFLLFFVLFVKIGGKNETVFYHGAEHKCVSCYRNGDELTLENVKKHPIRLPACGTSLLFLTIIFSIPVFLFLNYENLVFRIVIMLFLLVFLIGFSFEITLWVENNSDSIVARILSAPGLFLQRFNTEEPDDKHLEVAIVALKNLIKMAAPGHK